MMQAIRAGLNLVRNLGLAAIALGFFLAIFVNVRYGAIAMGLGLGARTIVEILAQGERRRLQLMIPFIIAVALVTVALALPNSSA
jgi:predicted nucleic acid-binding Zn ribbon protein